MEEGQTTEAEGVALRMIELTGMDVTRDSKSEYIEEHWKAKRLDTGEIVRYIKYILLYDPKGPKERKV